ncbi:hypothetical protein GXW82_07205 [Streptacidiphilus sp. 4-A2]|nr:hypothetical protein [Streptacidiphilus sp. 4-A2]
MTTTRQTINHRRRLASRPTADSATAPQSRPTSEPASGTPGPAEVGGTGLRLRPRVSAEPDQAAGAAEPAGTDAATPGGRGRAALRALVRPRPPLLAVLLTVVLGCFAGYAQARTGSLDSGPGRTNTALTDAARTSQVKGSITQAVNTLFSYDYADPARTDDAAGGLLTGGAVKQYASMLSAVRADAGKLKLVLTTTVTDCGLEQLDGDRAQLLVFADQRDTTTGAGTSAAAASEDSPAMFTVSAVLVKGTWRISDIGTFSTG